MPGREVLPSARGPTASAAARPTHQTASGTTDGPRAVAKAQPAPRRHARPSREPRVRRLLASAEAALKKSRLTQPAGDNAYGYYRRVLALDPKNAKAKEGLTRIALRYSWLAETEIAKYNYSKARMYIRRGLDVEPDNAKLLLLKKEAKLRNAPKQVFQDVKGLFRGIKLPK